MLRLSRTMSQALKVQRDRAEAEAEGERRRAAAAEQEGRLTAESIKKDAFSLDQHI